MNGHAYVPDIDMQECSILLTAPSKSVDHYKQAVKEKFQIMLVLLKCTGLYFGSIKEGKFWYYMGIARACFLCIITVYKTSFMVWYFLTRQECIMCDNPGSIVLISWGLKSTVSMIFLVYWQLKGYVVELFMTLDWPHTSEENIKIKRSVHTVLMVSAGIFIVCVITTIISMYFAYSGGSYKSLIDVEEMKMAFYINASTYIAFIIFIYMFLVWLIVLTFYVIVSNVVHGELRRFSKSLKEKLQTCTKDHMADAILEKYSTHLDMANMVHTVDNFFEVYTFIMIGTNIPTSVFTLITLVIGLRHSWHTMLFSIPVVTFSLLELVGLTVYPARVHAIVWKPYNEQVYQIANSFVAHASQTDLGISIWGFAVVSKPLILTTVSLTITYLTILLQIGNDQAAKCICPANNHSVAPMLI